jgi:hypothetical protein
MQWLGAYPECIEIEDAIMLAFCCSTLRLDAAACCCVDASSSQQRQQLDVYRRICLKQQHDA